MSGTTIVTGQKISPAKLLRAKEFRSMMTPAERRLWSRLRKNSLEGNHFRRQQIIDPYIVDFYCDKAKLVIELDGGCHSEQKDYDLQRDQFLEDMDLIVMRFPNSEIFENIDAVLENILRVCKESVA